jgi:serine/threonine-protein kinase
VKQIIGHYELLEKLGAGGMGVVYKARDLRLGRIVAVKVLSADKLLQSSQRERLVREAKIASALNHPNIVTIHDIYYEGGIELIAMEYVAGQPLRAVIQSGRLPLAQALNYALQIAGGLGRAHAAGVIHRDLKPSNIMVSDSGLLKILDFGLAKRDNKPTDGNEITATRSISEVGLIMGTVAYMSPEQALARRADARSDVYSFGVILYEMLAGEEPFRAEDTISTLRKVQIQPPRSLLEKRPELPEKLEQIVMKALQKEPEDRYQTVDDMAVDLRSVLADIDGTRQGAAKKFGMRWIMAGLIALTGLMFVIQLPFIRRAIYPSNSTSPASAFEWVKQGRVYLQRYDQPGNIDSALAAFQNAIRQDRNYAPAHAALAEAYFRKDAATPDPQWKRLAGDSARNGVRLNPDLAVTHLALGMVLLRTGKADEAQAELLRAQELDPLNGSVCIWLGEYYVEKRDLMQAEEFYIKARELAPEDWNTHQYLGRFLFKNSRYQEAAEAWEQAKKLAPDNILVLRSLAGAYHALDRDDEVWALLQRALEISSSATTYSNMGTFRFDAGQYTDAAEAFEHAVELNPTDYLYWGNLGDAHRWIPGHEDKAKEAYLRAIQLAQEKLASQKDDPDVRSRLAMYFAKSGDKEQTLEQISELEKIPARTAGTYFKSLIAYEIVRERDKAIRDLNVALRLGYPLKEISNEPELASLRMDRRYHTAVARVSGK